MNEENSNKNDIEEEIEIPEIPALHNKDVKTQCGAGQDGRCIRASAIIGIYDWLDTFCLALSMMVLLFLFVFKYVTVDGTSMLDTLQDGQKLIITDLSSYEPGDVVVICQPGSEKPLVKRIIAVGGQTVDIDFATWTVYVDGVPLDEPYVRRIAGVGMKSYGFSGHIVVKEGSVFVMGDNRNGSTDSRVLGCIDERNILGKVIYRVFPFNAAGRVK